MPSSGWLSVTELSAAEIYQKIEDSAVAAAAVELLPALKNAVSGASGTALSNVALYPLDLVVTRLQVQSKAPQSESEKIDDETQFDGVFDAVDKIYRNEGGIPAFYSGVAHDTAKDAVDMFLFFLAYNLVWRGRNRLPLSKHPVLQAIDGLGVGVVAGAATKALTMPIQNIVTHKQARPRASVGTIMDDIRRDKGIAGFWSGYSASLVLTLNPSVTFALDAFLRRIFKTGSHPSPFMTFLLAANGKATAAMLMYPIKMARARAQMSKGKSGAPENVFQAIAQIARTEGWQNLYAGIGGEVAKGFFSHGLTMLFKERIQMWALQLYYVLAQIMRRQSKLSK